MSLKKQAISGVIWTFAQQFSVQIINFGVQIVLARLLMPEMFGLIAMLSVFISIGSMLMDGGMTSSLIRTKNPDQLDYSTVFMTNMLVSIGAYLLTFVGAPYVAKFYDQEILKSILRVYALSFVIRAFMAVHMAKLTKEMDFKTQMRIQVPSVVVGAIVGIGMAYMGYGVWSLVWMNLVQTIINTLQCWIILPWRPSFVFNKEKFKYHFNFGYKLTLSGLLDTIYRNIYVIVVGKSFSPQLVGYFSQAETMRKFPVDQLSSVLGKVTYPLFSNIQGDEALKKAYKTTMKLQFLLVVPMMMILIVVGHEFFYFLFGEKWLPAVPYFQILSIASIMLPLTVYNLNILKVKGRSDTLLKLEIIKKTLGFLAVLVAIPFGMMTLVVSYMIVSILNTFINMIFSGKHINYYFLEQLKDCGRIYLIGASSFGLMCILKPYILNYINNTFVIMIIISVLFMIVYSLLIFVFEKEMITIIKNINK